MQYSLITKNSILYELFCPHFFLLNMGQRGGERGDEEGRKAGMGWDRELVVRWGGGNWGAGTTLLRQQTDWQKCKQLWCKEREREREREVSAP